MKIILLLTALFVISCKSGIKKNEEYVYELHLDLINIQTRLAYKRDSLNESFRLFSKYYTHHAREKMIESEMAEYYQRWNSPYDIKKDTALTLEKYLKYCEAHNYDPEKYLEFLR